jgi:hypothetical protein
MADTPKTPQEMAQTEVNKKVAKALANIEIERRRLHARIKKLDKKEKKLLDGELIPNDDGSLPDDGEEDDSPSHHTKVVILLDESGSMLSKKEGTISGFNEYISTLKAKGNHFSVTLTKFGENRIETPFVDIPISKVPKLSDENYKPDGMTPLYDAISKTINKTRGKSHTLFMILTDGEENASKECTRETISKLIKECEKDGWTFAYVGSGLDAWQHERNASSIGIYSGNVCCISGNMTVAHMHSLGNTTVSYSCSRGTTKNLFSDSK